MKNLNKVLFTAALMMAGSLAIGQVATVAAEGIRGGAQTGNPADNDPWWAEMTVIPAPSASDMVNGVTATQIGTETNHSGGAFDFAALTDGQGETAYPGQLPADHGEDGADNVAISMFWPVSGTVGAVVAYCFNYNNDTEGDVRAIPVVDVYTTTDATPTAGGTWTLLNTGGHLHTNAAPLSKTWGDTNDNRGCAIVVADQGGAALGTGLTGIRVDFFPSGFANGLRDSTQFGVGVEAVSTPFIAEVDVLATSPISSGVNDWTMF